VPRAPKQDGTGEEVLFLTSQVRLYNAYLAWYEKSRRGDPQNQADAAEQCRFLLRYLKVPTSSELAAYRRRQLPDDFIG
jgi:hypothetical protein